MSDIKQLIARLCVLCEALYPEEYIGKYTGEREALRTWLNEKTGLNVCHITDKENAINAWVEKLESIAQQNNVVI